VYCFLKIQSTLLPRFDRFLNKFPTSSDSGHKHSLQALYAHKLYAHKLYAHKLYAHKLYAHSKKGREMR